MTEVMGIIGLSALIVFLRQEKTPGRFSSIAYLAATACVPLQASSYFDSRFIGCVAQLPDLEGEPTARAFPVSLILHAIVTVSHWFMGVQTNARAQELLAVQRLRRDLVEASAKNKKIK